MSSRAIIKEFIDKYRECECLWNKNDSDYKIKFKRRSALEQLLKILKKIDEHANRDSVVRRINTLRNCFKKEYNKVKAANHSGANLEDLHVPKLWYYNLMLFLVNPDESNKYIASKLSEEMDGSPTSDTCEPPSTSASQSDSPTKRNKLTLNTQTVPRETISVEHEPQGEIEILSKGWAMKLNRLAPDQRLYAERIINDTLFEAELGTLTRHGVSFITSLSSERSISPASAASDTS